MQHIANLCYKSVPVNLVETLFEAERTTQLLLFTLELPISLKEANK